jgi:hypothetical protein
MMQKTDTQPSDPTKHLHQTLSRRQTLVAAAWTAPVIMHVGSTKAFAASVLVDALRFTSQGGGAQYGTNWGTAGEVQFWYSMENVLMQNPAGQSASITTTVTLKGGASSTITATYPVGAGSSYSDATQKWIVPGYAAGQLNTFYFTMSAPGFETVTSAEFTVQMP